MNRFIFHGTSFLPGDDRKMWGLSRLWGSLGYGLASLFVSLLIEKLGDREATHGESIDYTPSFYIYLIISLSNGIVAYFHPTTDGIKSSEVLKGKCTCYFGG